MDFKKIDNILNKYFEGLTSLEEEKILKEYFASDNIAEEHYPYKAMFNYFEQASSVTNPEPVRLNNNRKNYRTYYATAIAGIVGLGLFVIMQTDFKKNLNVNNTATSIQASTKNPEKKKEAVKEIKKFTRNVNKGIKKTGALSIFGTTTQKVFNLKEEEK